MAATQLFPILATSDLERALTFYRDALGGSVGFEFRSPDGQLAYVGVDLGQSHLGIGLEAGASGAPSGRGRITLWAYVDDCDATVAELRAAGVAVIEEPADQVWGERTARVLDPDGNEVIIGQAGAR